MSFERWGYQFEGAWADPNNVESRSVVYVIWCKFSRWQDLNHKNNTKTSEV